MTKMTRKTPVKYPFLATEFHSLKSDTHSWAWASPVVVKMNRLGTEGTRERSQAVKMNLHIETERVIISNASFEECLISSQDAGEIYK